VSDLKGYSQLQARFKALGKTEQLVRKIVIRGTANAKHIVPRKTGNLGRTIRPGRITPTTGELVAGGRLNVGYAKPVEVGSRPHIIRPVRRKALAWGGDRRLSGSLRTGASATHFATIVHHPGNRPHPYLVPGLQEAVKQEGSKAVVALWDSGA
jgi:hypothetical protein